MLLAAEDVIVDLLGVERLHQLRALSLEPLDLTAESRSLLFFVGAQFGRDAADALPNQVGRLAAQANGWDEPISLLVGDLDADVRLRAAAFAQAVEVVVAAAAALAPREREQRAAVGAVERSFQVVEVAVLAGAGVVADRDDVLDALEEFVADQSRVRPFVLVLAVVDTADASSRLPSVHRSSIPNCFSTARWLEIRSPVVVLG